MWINTLHNKISKTVWTPITRRSKSTYDHQVAQYWLHLKSRTIKWNKHITIRKWHVCSCVILCGCRTTPCRKDTPNTPYRSISCNNGINKRNEMRLHNVKDAGKRHNQHISHTISTHYHKLMDQWIKHLKYTNVDVAVPNTPRSSKLILRNDNGERNRQDMILCMI